MSSHSSRIPPSPPPAGTAGLRADALHNRERILAAAGEAFATLGIDVPMAAIARRAGVGMATLYRRFPTRESLITEVFADQLKVCSSVVDDALADPDPWRGFRTVVEKVCAMQIADRGFTAAFLTAFPGAVDHERERVRAEHGLTELIRRAKEAGRLRADFEQADLVLLFMANGGIVAETTEDALTASRRLVAYLLRSFQADRPDHPDRSAPLPPAPPFGLRHIPHLPPVRSAG
ncbi:TetR/AcrR family transcriptional regulator [Streptosporangium sp. NPDC002721]|uniref:TetR/AcrR family transcriptional regulator n=1 Tax=Streptosporangium sp. NPDC002721 TaxID=3366188 RepID=UPI0036AC7AB2